MDFVIMANAWQDGQTNPTSKHHIAGELVKLKHRVLWVNVAGQRTPNFTTMNDWKRIREKLRQARQNLLRPVENLWVISPLTIPIPENRVARKINAWIYLSKIKKMLNKLGLEEPVLISFIPIVPDILTKWRGKKIYYCVDKWDAFKNYNQNLMRSLNEFYCRNSDLVITTSDELMRIANKSNKRVELILHGVDFENFSRAMDIVKRPKDLPDWKKIVGFIGLISEWVDQNLLIKLARRCKSANIVLIGKADVDTKLLEAEANIYLLGAKPFKELPQYMAFFSVGIIPFIINDLTTAVNPIKLREMLAAGCPVVSTELPEVTKYRKFVQIGEDRNDFVEKVIGLLELRLNRYEKQKMSIKMAGQKWENKAVKLTSLIEDLNNYKY